MRTWGAYFPYLFFVFGRNKFDYDYLNNNCVERRSDTGSSRHLLPRSPQVPIKHEHKSYRCPLNVSNNKDTISSVNILYTANCTGEYFGIGPTCRCQEAMRFFIARGEFCGAEWFIFMDDDIYYRPYSLVSMLQSIQNNQSLSSLPIGVIATDKPRSLVNIRPKKAVNLSTSCAEVFMHNVYLTQPAFLNRKAVTTLQQAIDSNSLTRLHSHWGSSHDAILGILLWMYEIPLFSMQQVYYGGPIVRQWLSTLSDVKKEQFQNYVAFHKVMNYQRYSYDKDLKKMVEKGYVVDQYDIADLLEERSLYDHANDPKSVHIRKLIIQRQILLGQAATESLIALNRSRIVQTRFVERVRDFPHTFSEFQHSDCDYSRQLA